MDTIIFTRDPISIPEALAALPPRLESGARIWFEGMVRKENNGRAVQGLFYESYPEMAKQELEKIIAEARQKWPLHQMVITHRLGKLKVGETSLVVVIETSHRKEGFEAIQYIINQLKQRVPIWKKEIYEIGEEKWL